MDTGVAEAGAKIAEGTPAELILRAGGEHVVNFTLAGDAPVSPAAEAELFQLTAVRSGPDGEIYVLEGSGAIHRLVPG